MKSAFKKVLALFIVTLLALSAISAFATKSYDFPVLPDDGYLPSDPQYYLNGMTDRDFTVEFFNRVDFTDMRISDTNIEKAFNTAKAKYDKLTDKSSVREKQAVDAAMLAVLDLWFDWYLDYNKKQIEFTPTNAPYHVYTDGLMNESGMYLGGQYMGWPEGFFGDKKEKYEGVEGLNWFGFKKRDNGLTGYGTHSHLLYGAANFAREIIKNRDDDGNYTGGYNIDELVKRVFFFWDDYSSNYWRAIETINGDLEFRNELLDFFGMTEKTVPKEWGFTMFTSQILCVSWQLNGIQQSISPYLHLDKAILKKNISSRTMAEIVYNTCEKVFNQMFDIASDIDRAPNQQQDTVKAFVGMDLMFPAMKSLTSKHLGKMNCWLMDQSSQYDGSGSELSFNYMGVYIGATAEMRSLEYLYPDLVEIASKNHTLRWMFLSNTMTPSGHMLKEQAPSRLTRESVDERLGERGYSSIYMPYYGLLALTNSWGADTSDTTYLSVQFPRHGNGHEGEGRNKIYFEAYGKEFLWNSEKDGNGPHAYNVVLADNYAQYRRGANKANHAAYKDTQDGYYYTNDRITYGEGIADDGYIRGTDVIDDVIHERRVAYFKDLAAYFVIDFMRNNGDKKHEYCQPWNFHASFGENQVLLDENKNKIYTNAEGSPNLYMYQAASTPIKYNYWRGYTKYGSITPWEAFGWNDGTPANSVHATFGGETGNQVCITAFVPIKMGEKDRVKSFKVLKLEEEGKFGVELVVNGGKSAKYIANLLGDGVTGSLLETKNGKYTDTLEFNQTGEGHYRNGGRVLVNGKEVDKITVPGDFQWYKDKDGKLCPSYKVGDHEVAVAENINFDNKQVAMIVDNPKGLINGEEVVSIDSENEEVTPKVIDGRTLVPVRFLSENFTCNVGWEKETSTVTVSCGSVQAKMKIGETKYTVNGVEKEMDVPPQIVNERTMLPLRTLCEDMLGMEVFWNEANSMIVVTRGTPAKLKDTSTKVIQNVLKKLKQKS